MSGTPCCYRAAKACSCNLVTFFIGTSEAALGLPQVSQHMIMPFCCHCLYCLQQIAAAEKGLASLDGIDGPKAAWAGPSADGSSQPAAQVCNGWVALDGRGGAHPCHWTGYRFTMKH